MVCPAAARSKILWWFLLFKRHMPPKKQKKKGVEYKVAMSREGPTVPAGRELMAAHTAAFQVLDNQHR